MKNSFVQNILLQQRKQDISDNFTDFRKKGLIFSKCAKVSQRVRNLRVFLIVTSLTPNRIYNVLNCFNAGEPFTVLVRYAV